MAAGSFAHLPVMPQQLLEYLNPPAAGIFLDGTLGGGGHARLVLEATGAEAKLIGLDRDPAALQAAAAELAIYGGRVQLLHRNFSQAREVAEELGINGFDGILFDLGVSSHQLDTRERGFSFRSPGPLDMRMDQTAGLSAADVLADAEAEELTRIFRQYGEERYAGRIARRIVQNRQDRPLETTEQLAALVRDAVPGGYVPARIHPATRVFQALRIYVNDELGHVETGVRTAIDLLKPQGRLVVISFHSLEDRIVKHLFREESQNCVCPPRLPVCACSHKARVALLTRRGQRADEEEIEHNPRARSAILRAVRKI